MNKTISQAIERVYYLFKEKPSENITPRAIFEGLKGEVTEDHIHYALRKLKDGKYIHQPKHGTYQKTGMDKPLEKIFAKKRRKPRKKAEPLVSFEKKLEEWDNEQKKIDWQDLCQKLQNALAKAYVDIDLLEATVSEQRIVIKYLENKNGSNPV